MTQQQIDNAKSLVANVATIKRRHEKELSDARKEIFNALADCDHRLPDGKSAMRASVVTDRCTICGKYEH